MRTPLPVGPARAWVDVDLDALVANARTIAARAGRPLLPMVKANGYGLGATAVARALEAVAPWGYGVATLEEGAELRAAGLDRPVIVFTPFAPAVAAADLYRAHRLRPVIGDVAGLEAWRTRTGAGPDAPFHLEIDTGMSRGGVRWNDTAALDALAEALRDAAGWEGVFTHFHSADCDPASAAVQWERFEGVLARLPRRPPLVHAANSAGALLDRGYAGDLVRPGIHLYGGACGGEPAPQPVAALRARVVALRTVQPGETVSYGATWRAEVPTTIATLGIGYADGVPRALSNGGRVEIGGEIVSVAGRVTMDMTMIALASPPAARVAVGDVATLYGGRVSLDEQAARAGTIGYELLTALGPRLPRRYHGGPHGGPHGGTRSTETA
ncbi:MAG TPA: alanine racemase [Gemmatimonadales bacterium]|nr:alanine racemase [Gemmatimonadales bacterium]